MSKLCFPLVLVALGGLGLPASATAQTVLSQIHDCMNTTGMALHGGHSAATANSSISWLFGGPGGGEVYCGPEFGGSAILSAGGATGGTSFYGGTGLVSNAHALASPEVFGKAQGFHKIELILKFRVVPDDPASTAPVEVDFNIRERYFEVDTQISGLVTATNSIRTVYNVNTTPNLAGASSGTQPGRWYNDYYTPVSNTIFDQSGTVSIPPNQDRYFHAYLEITNIANAHEDPSGSSAVTQSVQFSFEATTEDAATIVFENETRIGLDPPMIDSVPEPGLTTGLPVALLFSVGVARSRGARP